MTTAAAVIATALKYRGYVEGGGADGKSGNITRFWAETEPALQGSSWCADFVSCVFREAGHPLPPIDRPYGFINCGSAVNWGRAHAMWSASGKYSPGDVVIFGGNQHTGIVISDDGTTLVTIEGNTSPDGSTGSQTNGGGVYVKHRPHGPWVTGVLTMSKVLDQPEIAHPVVAKDPVPAKAVLQVTGTADKATKMALQRWLGVYPDGVWGSKTAAALQKRQGISVDGVWGPNTTRALQHLVGASQDGALGPKTVTALQRFLNAHL